MVAAFHCGQRTGGDYDSRVTNDRNLLKNARMFRRSALLLSSLLVLRSLYADGVPEVKNEVIVSVKDQKLMLLQNGAQVTTYPVSTSKFGIGDSSGRMTTPIGAMAVAQKIGDHAPTGAVFHNRRFTGEIIKPNAPGRDPIITRIIWLRGLEASTSRAFSRCIYIHGTPEEKKIGQPASYGCIRMKSKDVTALYSQLPVGAVVQVVPDKLPRVPKARTIYQIQAPDAPVEKGRPAPFVKSQGAARRL
jgi:lipoprotein-anchoring transpeptidase ErfK/SrfK